MNDKNVRCSPYFELLRSTSQLLTTVAVPSIVFREHLGLACFCEALLQGDAVLPTSSSLRLLGLELLILERLYEFENVHAPLIVGTCTVEKSIISVWGPLEDNGFSHF